MAVHVIGNGDSRYIIIMSLMSMHMWLLSDHMLDGESYIEFRIGKVSE